MLLAYRMIIRVKKQNMKEMKEIPVPQGVFQKGSMTDRFMSCIQSSLGLLYNHMGRSHDTQYQGFESDDANTGPI